MRGALGRKLIERRLADVSNRLRRAQEELQVVAEQSEHLDADADEARIRAVVSDSPFAAQEHRAAQGPADALGRERVRLMSLIEDLRRRQDELLDDLSAASSPR